MKKGERRKEKEEAKEQTGKKNVVSVQEHAKISEIHRRIEKRGELACKHSPDTNAATNLTMLYSIF